MGLEVSRWIAVFHEFASSSHSKSMMVAEADGYGKRGF
jgi:hypothetical protein